MAWLNEQFSQLIGGSTKLVRQLRHLPNDIGNRNARGQVYEAGYQAIQGMMRNLIVQLLLKYPFSLDFITKEVREVQGHVSFATSAHYC